ncbi:hypothetical protein E2C01_034782 [Portunus trituberculatus]|uniref:Uncharacterized protein n=1 Tax=Portunus trituberculatus TaxID=210409 RepID=A0A5B7F6F4_PORTR|nr:hypothetical protein [Portunus trituberculatus]
MAVEAQATVHCHSQHFDMFLEGKCLASKASSPQTAGEAAGDQGYLRSLRQDLKTLVKAPDSSLAKRLRRQGDVIQASGFILLNFPHQPLNPSRSHLNLNNGAACFLREATQYLIQAVCLALAAAWQQ